MCCELCCSLNLRLHSETGRVAALLYIGDVVTSLTADGFWAVPLVAPPIFVNWIERHRHLAPPLDWLEMGRRCRIQLCATRLRMRIVSEIAHRSTESERNSAEQHRPPSIRQSFSHGDVCFYQSSPLDFLFFVLFLQRLSFWHFIFTFWLKSRNFPPKSEWIVIFCVLSTSSAPRIVVSSKNNLTLYQLDFLLSYFALNTAKIQIISQNIIQFTVFVTFSVETRRKMCYPRIPCFNTWSWNFDSFWRLILLCFVCVIIPLRKANPKNQEIRSQIFLSSGSQTDSIDDTFGKHGKMIFHL